MIPIKIQRDISVCTLLISLLHLKWITSKDLLYSTENSAQCYVAVLIGAEFAGEWIHVCKWLNLYNLSFFSCINHVFHVVSKISFPSLVTKNFLVYHNKL